ISWHAAVPKSFWNWPAHCSARSAPFMSLTTGANPFFASALTKANRETNMTSKHKLQLAGSILLSFLAFTQVGVAATTPFTVMAGAWSGDGTMTTSGGTQERLRCRAQYSLVGAGNEMQLNLRCASESYNFDLAGQVEYLHGMISGSWKEATHNASGTISG